MAPADRRAQRLVPGRGTARDRAHGTVPAARGQQPEPVVQPLQQLCGGQRPQPSGRQLQRQRNPLQAPAQLAYLGAPGHLQPLLPGPVGEQLHRLVLVERRQPPQQLGRQLGTGVHQMLEPVQDQQDRTAGEMLQQGLAGGADGVVGQPQRLRDRVLDELRIAHRCQFHPPGTRLPVGGGPRGQPGLADPADPRDGHQPGPAEGAGQLGEFGRAPDERGQFQGRIAVGEGIWALRTSHRTRSVLKCVHCVQSLPRLRLPAPVIRYGATAPAR